METHSLGAQESRFRFLAESRGTKLDRVFIDAGYSAATLKRLALQNSLPRSEAVESAPFTLANSTAFPGTLTTFGRSFAFVKGTTLPW